MLRQCALRAIRSLPLSRNRLNHTSKLGLCIKSTRVPYIACMAQLDAEAMAVVKNPPGATSLTIQVQICGKIRNLDRPKDEMLEKPLVRLQKTACQKPAKGKKKSREAAEEIPVPEVAIYGGPDESFPLLDPLKTTNDVGWKDGNMLKIGDAKYVIVVNPPCVDKLQVYGSLFVDVPVVPYVEMSNTDTLKWQWFRWGDADDDWVPVVDGFERSFVPKPGDIGAKLKVTCMPVQRRLRAGQDSDSYDLEGFSSSIVVGPVGSAPMFASASRVGDPLPLTKHPGFRVMTYNILADQYASTDSARDVIFSHCESQWLGPQYRRPLVFKEILDYNPDIACLQEVDASAFDSLLEPGLREHGMDGIFTNKAGRVKEGSATFWRRDRFHRLDSDAMEMRKYFPKDSSKKEINMAPLGPPLRPMLESSPMLCEALQKVGTIAQLTLLVPTGVPAQWGLARPVCVVNTHLFFHYAAPHIRTIHVWAMLLHANDFIRKNLEERGEELGDKLPSLIFCGDLNSDINDGIPGVVRLLSSGSIEKNYWDWKFGRDFAWGSAGRGDGDDDGDQMATGGATVRVSLGDGELANIVAGMDLKSPFSLNSADDMVPEFTNYVKGYQGLLDYVWYDRDHIQVKSTVPCPTKEELKGFLPSEQFPSDHLAVVADLEFVDRDVVAANGEVDTSMSENGIHLDAVYRNVVHAEEALLQERVIAVPTDTIYGIAAMASSSKAINAIYAIKRRDLAKPLAVCVADHQDIHEICHTNHLPSDLLQKLLPGPVTVLLDRKRNPRQLSDDLNPGIDALAVRIPDFAFLRAICRQLQTPLALTSANISGEQSPVHTSEFGHISESCAFIFDHGRLGQKRSGSTIVDLRCPGKFQITREGSAMEKP
jgi:2',5'-phosphodiesterase